MKNLLIIVAFIVTLAACRTDVEELAQRELGEQFDCDFNENKIAICTSGREAFVCFANDDRDRVVCLRAESPRAWKQSESMPAAEAQ